MKTRLSADTSFRTLVGQGDRNSMISIKRFLDRHHDGPGPHTPAGAEDVVAALTQMGHLLLGAIATNMVLGNEIDLMALRKTMNGLARQMAGPQTALNVLSISSDAIEGLETYCLNTTEYLREQNLERQSMVAMLTETVTDLSGQTDASVVRLHAIEKQVERASELGDIRALRADLGKSLLALREAAALQRRSSTATVERLQGQIEVAQTRIPEDPKPSGYTLADIDLIPEPSEDTVESLSAAYVAAFRLQRAEHVASRFGEPVKRQMQSMVAAQLKAVLGPTDRLLRWKGTSFVMFINSTAPLKEIRARLQKAVAATSEQYVEAGGKTALLAVGVDWVIFPQADHQSLSAVFIEVDTFLANAQPTPSRVMARR
jgi:GGDEF domain-containing protein